ncbi:hypothetical protein DD238_007775 [Peronospora effusa]|uniref:Protein kinase domain-containing protein n=1 Tax=Peronospora effusa TaxID=542832 RepID=A0A3M6VBT9_9STRA|nr:hypothetical protein DD238_007775 [Peronospora effusa]
MDTSPMNASAESDVDLMHTILGEHVPQSVILTCLNACAFDVSAALNWYFAEVALSPAVAIQATDVPPSSIVSNIQSGLSLTLHARAVEGMVSKSEAYYATLTKGDPAYDMLTPSNEKFLTIRLRKRGWRTGKLLGLPSPATQRPFFANGDVVTLECNGLWLKANSINKMLQWKAPSEDDRNKFVVRGLPLGKSLAPGDYFFLTSYKWKDKEIVCKDERPVGTSSYNTNVHRCFLGLERIKTYGCLLFFLFFVVDSANQRLYLYAKLTSNAVKSLSRPDDPIDFGHLTISVMGTPISPGSTTPREQAHSRRTDSISDEIHFANAKIEQMANITGTDVSRDRLANFLDGAGGDVQVALEHYFMSVSTAASSSAPTQCVTSVSSAPLPTQSDVAESAAALEEVQARGHGEAQAHHDRCPLSQLILGIPSISETALSPSTEPLSITPPAAKAKYRAIVDPPRPPSVDATSTLVGEPSPGMPPPVPSSCQLPFPPSIASISNSGMTTVPVPLSAAGGAPVLRITEDEVLLDTTDYSKHPKQTVQRMTVLEQQSETIAEAESERAEALTIQDFEMLSVLGKGSFGAVMLVRFKKDGRVFALKIIKKNNMDQADVQNAMEERQILQRIHHPYICGLVFAFQTNERLYLGMKYYAAGDLFYHLNIKGHLGVKDAKLYGAELVLAISYLHELNILYRDLKPSNVMIDSEGHIGVVDFGLSKQHIYGSNFGVKTLSGTAEYVAPEALAQSADGSRNYGKAYDWWSLGIVIYEMLVGESPFYEENEHKMLSRIAYSDVVFPSDFPRDAYKLVKGLLSKDPKQRLGSEQMGGVDAIKSCQFFRHIDWDKLLRREVKAHWTPKLSGETDTRYVDPEFIDEGPPSAAYDPSATSGNSRSKRFSQFSFNYSLG